MERFVGGIDVSARLELDVEDQMELSIRWIVLGGATGWVVSASEASLGVCTSMRLRFRSCSSPSFGRPLTLRLTRFSKARTRSRMTCLNKVNSRSAF